MIVTTIYNDKIQSIVLPEKKNGQFEVFCYVGNEKKSISNIEKHDRKRSRNGCNDTGANSFKG